ncbi:MAG: protein adenylyltransferase SelO [Gammaproteobacteria bacterium]
MNPISLNSYRTLPKHMFSDDTPAATREPRLVILNDALLCEYEVPDTWFRSADGLGILSGNAVNHDNPPIAMAYVGHQFGHRAPMLGDGRAHMLGQMQTAHGNIDIQLKGSGATAFSRGGDGRATLASVLREHIVSEAMAGLGIPTTRSLAVVTTGDTVYREQPEPGGLLARTARSHIRVGSFEYAADQPGDEAVRALADYMIEQHFPAVVSAENRYAELLLTVGELQARLIAQWMLVGFIHGVMNTDNMSIVGETIDFGPCAFMDEFNAEKVFSSIDQHGRYAWGRQPGIGLWNLMRLAETLLPLLSSDRDIAVKMAETQLTQFMPAFQTHFYAGLRKKLGLPDQSSAKSPGSNEFADQTLALLNEKAIDMTVFFDTLTGVASGESEHSLLGLLGDNPGSKAWLEEWKQIRTDNDSTIQTMRLANPAIIARNHRVEEALLAATKLEDLQPFLRLTEALQNPFNCTPENAELKTPPLPQERVKATFCGT